MAFRLARLEDLPKIVPLMKAFYEEDRHPWNEEAARRTLAHLLQDAGAGRAFLIEDGATVLGYLVVCFGFSLEFHGRDAFLDELYVLPAARGRGLGREALGVAEACCREAGAGALHLEVGLENEKARRLYRGWGFADRPHTLMSKRLDG